MKLFWVIGNDIRKEQECGPEPLLLGQIGSQLMGSSETLCIIGLGTAYSREKETRSQFN